jgi:plasmid stabilization system protein ParE
MPYNIEWSPRAKFTHQQILDYLQKNWTEKEINNFVTRTETVLLYISQNPLQYPYSKENDIHKCVLRKQVSLYYQIKQNTVELLYFWDNRQNPKKPKL